ncbi:MAG: GxxExxY protein [Melioribacter sp.]|nr:GxxExxY protein [Melioribacter sp.]
MIADKTKILHSELTENICEEHEAQLINYLKATNIEVGLLLNFGKNAEFKRKIFINEKKISAEIR